MDAKTLKNGDGNGDGEDEEIFKIRGGEILKFMTFFKFSTFKMEVKMDLFFFYLYFYFSFLLKSDQKPL